MEKYVYKKTSRYLCVNIIMNQKQNKNANQLKLYVTLNVDYLTVIIK